MRGTFCSVVLAGFAFCARVSSKIIPRQQGSLPPVSSSKFLFRRFGSFSNDSKVTSEGNAFWANGDRFYIRGVAYQPGM